MGVGGRQRCLVGLVIFVASTIVLFADILFEESSSRPASSSISLNPKMLIYNAVQKTGSQTMNKLFKKLSDPKRRDFDYHHFSCQASGNNSRQKSDYEQEVFRRRVLSKAKKHRKVLISQEVHFIEFPLDELHPTYFTMLRDPVERFRSRYRWSRIGKETAKTQFRSQGFYEPIAVRNLNFDQWRKRKFDECVLGDHRACNPQPGDIVDNQVSYLCGQGLKCVSFGDREGLQRAKDNIERYYPVVGVLEMLKETFVVMNRFLPMFAKAIRPLYNQHKEEYHLNSSSQKSGNVSEEIAEKLKKIFSVEYELYDFVKARLADQYMKVFTYIPTHKIIAIIAAFARSNHFSHYVQLSVFLGESLVVHQPHEIRAHLRR